MQRAVFAATVVAFLMLALLPVAVALAGYLPTIWPGTGQFRGFDSILTSTTSGDSSIIPIFDSGTDSPNLTSTFILCGNALKDMT